VLFRSHTTLPCLVEAARARKDCLTRTINGPDPHENSPGPARKIGLTRTTNGFGPHACAGHIGKREIEHRKSTPLGAAPDAGARAAALRKTLAGAPSGIYEEWFAGCKFEVGDNTVIVWAPNPRCRDEIKSSLRDVIVGAVDMVVGTSARIQVLCVSPASFEHGEVENAHC